MSKLNRSSFLIAVMLFAIVMAIVAQPGSAEAQSIKIIINGQQIASDVQPVIVSDRTYVPLRVVSENLGARVFWMGDSRQVVINWHTDNTPSLPRTDPDDIAIILDGKVLNIPAGYGQPFINSQWRTMIPLRAVGEALDCDVQWQSDTYSVVINSRQLSEEQRLFMDLAAYKTNLKLKDGSVLNSAVLANQDPSAYSDEQIEVFRTYLDQLAKYGANVILPTGETINVADLSIMGKSYLTADQLNAWVAREVKRLTPTLLSQGRIINITPNLAELYLKIGAEYGVRGDLAFCQAAKETGYWQFMGSVQPWQNNYCGLYAIGSPLTGTESANGADPSLVWFMPGIHGAIFATPKAGVEAHIQHLYAYATKKELPTGKVLVDPRFTLVSKGIAPAWLGLNARWAVPGTTYGQSIVFDYFKKAY